MAGSYDQHLKKMKKLGAASPSSQKTPKEISRQTQSGNVLAEKLRSKLKPAIEEKKRRRAIPWKLAGSSFVGLIIALMGLTYLDKIEDFLKRLEVQALAPASAEGAPPADGKAVEEKAAEVVKAEASTQQATVKKDFTQEEINHFARLNDRKRELDAREEELNRMETELSKQKEELEKRLADLEQTRRGISSALEDRVKVDEKKVETLVQVYSNMKPQQAAKVFESMDEDLAIEVLGRMKKKNAAEIMNLIKPEKAQVLSEKYAGYKRNVASEGGK